MRKTTLCVIATMVLAIGCGEPDDSAGPNGSGSSDTGVEPGSTAVAESTGQETSGMSTVGAVDSTGGPDSSDSGRTEGDDGSGDTESAPESDLPPVQWCNPTAAPIWETSEGGSGAAAFVSYTCSEPCRDVEACTFDDDAFSSAYFVVDHMAGTLRWQTGEDMVFVHNGGTGTSYPTGELVDQILAGGHGVAMPRWEPGADVDGASMGWASRPDETATDFVRVTARVASLVDWVDRELGDGQYATAGCSAGSYVTMAAQVWHGLGDRFAYQLFVGGPPFADVARGCGSEPAPAGVCSNDPSQTCDGDADCGVGPQTVCSTYLNNEQGPLAEMVDSVHRTEPACEEATARAAWDASNLLGRDGDFLLSHPVDFVVNMGPGFGDPMIGAYANAWDVSQSLSGAVVGWHEFQGTHCAAFSGSDAWPLLEAGMGWSSM